MLQINTNPDLDDYKESVIAGMTAKETLWAGAGLLAGSAASILLHMFLHIPLFLCIYAAIPVSIPFILTGFSIKDGMTYWQRRRQKKNRRKTPALCYISTECRSVYQNIERRTEKDQQEQDKEEEFDQLLKRMKRISMIAGILIVVIIIVIIAVLILGGRR